MKYWILKMHQQNSGYFLSIQKHVDMKTIDKALTIPYPYCDENTLKNRARSAYLITNPFIKGKKKKKKRSKKKKSK